MDITTLLAQAKARFGHNSAKDYLREKYNTKLFLADQGGLWKANLETINFLRNIDNEVVLLDTFNNPVKVNAPTLFLKLSEIYNTVMEEWYKELKEFEGKR